MQFLLSVPSIILRLVRKSLVQSPMTEFEFVTGCALTGDNVVLHPEIFL